MGGKFKLFIFIYACYIASPFYNLVGQINKKHLTKAWNFSPMKLDGILLEKREKVFVGMVLVVTDGTGVKEI